MAATEAATRAAATLDELYRAHVGDVYRYAYAVLGNHADAEDVTQTTFVNALRALERGERPLKPGNWLIVIAHNIVRQRWRQEHTRPAEVTLAIEVAEPESDEKDASLGEVVRALQRIPPSQREALVMRELEGRPYKEIAEMLDITTGALETLLFRARRSLAEEMENLVTCDGAQLAISRQLDGRLGRKDRRRLDEHLRECAACSAFAAGQRRRQRAVRGLAVLPLPASLVLWKGAPTASAAAALPAVGVGAGAATVTSAATVTGAAGGGAAAGGLALGGIAAKAAAVVAAVGVAGGVGYEGAKRVGGEPSAPPPASSAAGERASSASRASPERVVPGGAAAAAARANGAASAKTARDDKAARVAKRPVPSTMGRGTEKPAASKTAAERGHAKKAASARNATTGKPRARSRAVGDGASPARSSSREPRTAKTPEEQAPTRTRRESSPAPSKPAASAGGASKRTTKAGGALRAESAKARAPRAKKSQKGG